MKLRLASSERVFVYSTSHHQRPPVLPLSRGWGEGARIRGSNQTTSFSSISNWLPWCGLEFPYSRPFQCFGSVRPPLVSGLFWVTWKNRFAAELLCHRHLPLRGASSRASTPRPYSL